MTMNYVIIIIIQIITITLILVLVNNELRTYKLYNITISHLDANI